MRSVQSSFVSFILEQLHSLDCRARPMFGGYGLYLGDAFFGIISGDELFFRTDDHTRPEYETRGMQPFQPNAPQKLGRYYEVPPEVLEDSDTLTTWVRRAANRTP